MRKIGGGLLSQLRVEVQHRGRVVAAARCVHESQQGSARRVAAERVLRSRWLSLTRCLRLRLRLRVHRGTGQQRDDNRASGVYRSSPEAW
jgi:hypothetical protein